MTHLSYQLYSSRNFGPISDTLKMIGGLGYRQVEGYGGLFQTLDALDALKDDLAANDLHMASGHFGLEMVRDEPDRVIQIAEALNIGAIFVPAVGPEERTKDAAGWRALGETLARIGAPIWASGRTFGWHNHDFEFQATPSGEMPLDLILGADDRLALELDVAWVVRGGQDPLAWIEKYKTRLAAAHVKDIAPAGACADEDGWADVGTGTMDWPAIMAALRSAGTEIFVLEHDNPSDDRRFAQRSIENMARF